MYNLLLVEEFYRTSRLGGNLAWQARHDGDDLNGRTMGETVFARYSWWYPQALSSCLHIHIMYLYV